MCGIAGLIDPKGAATGEMAETARAMAQTLVHRGPDDSGLWVDDAAGVALAHRRLSIIDLTEQGRQPMASTSGRFVTVYNGEIYNYLTLRRDLSGERFKGNSDTEVLLAAASRWGVEEALKRANGMFAIGIYDRETRALHLARDRLGQKPLYYGWAGRYFAFASELKALRAIPGFAPDLDRAALVSYLRHGYVPAPNTIYAGVFKLMPGTLLSLPLTELAGRSLPAPKPYWSLEHVATAGTADPPRKNSTSFCAMPCATAWSPTCRSGPSFRAASTPPLSLP